MKKNVLRWSCLIFWGGLLIGSPTGCSWLSKTRAADEELSGNLENDYDLLLSRFPKEASGKGRDPFFDSVEHQPMAYGLIISAEAARFGRSAGEESLQYIRNGVSWLLSGANLDEGNFPGWGLPDAWDAFGDGTINPKNTPYAITTAICLLGLLDALELPLWTIEERIVISDLVKKVSLEWSRNAWSNTPDGGFFWFSPKPWDASFCPNVSAMFLGSLARVLSEKKNAFSENEYLFIRERIDRAAATIVSQAIWRGGVPYWNYVVQPGSSPQNDPNDLIHHVYILWGMELYRSFKGHVRVPWTSKQARRSLDRFWKNDKVYDYPQDLVYSGKYVYFNKNQARLWGMGSAIAFYAAFGDRQKAHKIVRLIDRDYGRFPDLRLLPREVSKDEKFYVREAAHVLWGLAVLSSKQR